jgi:hypothetical protein
MPFRQTGWFLPEQCRQVRVKSPLDPSNVIHITPHKNHPTGSAGRGCLKTQACLISTRDLTRIWRIDADFMDQIRFYPPDPRLKAIKIVETLAF